MKPGNFPGPSSCRGVTSLEYIILASLITAAVLAAFLHLELQIPRLFQNATGVLRHATVPVGQDQGGGPGTIENDAPVIPDKATARP